MKTIGFAFIFVVVGLFFSACSAHRFEFHDSDISPVPARDEFHNFFLSGVGQIQREDVAEICGGADKIFAIETEYAPLSLLVGLISAGIYTPRRFRVYCLK